MHPTIHATPRTPETSRSLPSAGRLPGAAARLPLRPVLLAAVALLLLAAAPAARACSCVQPAPPAQALEQVDAVFSGEVTAVERDAVERGRHRLLRQRVDLAVRGAWKGLQEGELEAGRVTLWTGLGGGDCGVSFEVGEEYLVYAYRQEDGTLHTDICTRTAPLEHADEDLQALGEPARHPDPKSP